MPSHASGIWTREREGETFPKGLSLVSSSFLESRGHEVGLE
jgi:hypothetical protein